ncbi:hypothetical protein [Silanimonas sp.]|uniref:hypothetical protein n=1 Tax=Silanimonas sp. TaxID=1929290 RepID=UPI0022C9224E|nr:hypothetical protein [Silanimonas sp.]MCZ8063999.1 hypothetical protein [Silanimonas sp.]
MTPQQILEEIRGNFTGGQRRRFLPGLAIALIGFLRELGAVNGRFKTLDEFYAEYPRLQAVRGRSLNTLGVRKPDGTTLTIRRFYDRAANWFREGNQRFDYPSAGPHATQAWGDYLHWIVAMLALSEEELCNLQSDIEAFVLAELPSQAIDPSKVVRKPPRFLWFLEQFDLAAKKGETSGAAYQGTVFGYIRADAPHLQVEVGKVRTGSKREKRVGDIDARDGADLVLSAEVKQFEVGTSVLPDLAEFANLIAQHKALGLVVALDFEPGAVATIEAMGLQPLSRKDLIDRVRIWDPLKQDIAMNAVLYYVSFREQSSPLYLRIKAFLEGVEEASANKNEMSTGIAVEASSDGKNAPE